MDLTNVVMAAIICSAIAAVILGVAFFINKASAATTAANKEIGVACTSAGGSWVLGATDYQCICGAK